MSPRDDQKNGNTASASRSIEDIVRNIMRNIAIPAVPSAYTYGWGNMPAPYQASSERKNDIAALLDPSFPWNNADPRANAIPDTQMQDHAPEEKGDDTAAPIPTPDENPIDINDPAHVAPAVFRGRGATTAAGIFEEQLVIRSAPDETAASLAQTLPIASDEGIPPIPHEALGDEAVREIQEAIQKNNETMPVENDDPGYPGGIVDILSHPPADFLPKQNGDTVSRVNHDHMARVLAAKRAATGNIDHVTVHQPNGRPLDIDLSTRNETSSPAPEKTKIKWGPAILGGIQASLGIAAYGCAALLAGLRSSVSRLPLVSALGQKNDMPQKGRDMNWRDTSYDPPSGIMRAFNIAAKVLPTAGSFALSAGVGFGIKTGLAIALGTTPVGLIAVGSAVAGGMLTSLAVGGIKDMMAKRAAYRSDSFDTASSGRRESRLMKHFKRAAIGAAGGFVGFEFGDEIKESLTSAFHSVADYGQNAGHTVKEMVSSWGWLQDILPGGTETPAPMAVSAPAIPAHPAPVPDHIAPEPIPDEPSAPEQPVVHDQPAAKQPPASHHVQRPVEPAPTPAPSAPAPDTEIKKVVVEESSIRAIEVNGATPRPELMTDPDAAANHATGSRPTVQFQATGNVGVQVDVYEATPNRSVQITADANGIQIVEEPGSHSGGNAGDTGAIHEDMTRQTASTGHDAYRQVFGYDSV